MNKAQLEAAKRLLLSPIPSDNWRGLDLVDKWLLRNVEDRSVYYLLVDVAKANPEVYEKIHEQIFQMIFGYESKNAARALKYLPINPKDYSDENYDYYISNNISEKAINWYYQGRLFISVHDYLTAINFLQAAIKISEDNGKDFRDAKDLLKQIKHQVRQQSNFHQKRLDNKQPISILFLSADPSDQARLRIGEEFREIQGEIERASLRKRFMLNVSTSVRTPDISRALLKHSPQFVHFTGHGRKEDGALIFEKSDGNSQFVEPGALAFLFEQFSGQVDCILLNACYTLQQAKAISKCINWVIGMTNQITDQAAVNFSIGFYQAIGAGKTIEQAFNLGCAHMGLGLDESSSKDPKPILLKRNTD